MVIYKTTNLANGKIYIGKDTKNDPEYLGSGLLLQNAIRKYGKNMFVKEIIEECSNQLALAEREKHWIESFKSTDRNIGYNIAEGGFGGDTFSNNPNKEEIRLKHKKATQRIMLERGGYLKDKEKQREACRKGNAVRTAAGYKHSEETKKKLSETLTGRIITDEWRKNISSATKEAMAKLDQKELQSKALQGRIKAWAKRDDERKEKLKSILALGLSTPENVKLLGVSTPTYYKILGLIKKENTQ